MATTLTGFLDYLIELEGDLDDEFYPGNDNRFGMIGFSDGTLICYTYLDGIGRFEATVKGNLFDHINHGSVSKGTFDVVHFKDGLEWAVLTKGDKKLLTDDESVKLIPHLGGFFYLQFNFRVR